MNTSLHQFAPVCTKGPKQVPQYTLPSVEFLQVNFVKSWLELKKISCFRTGGERKEKKPQLLVFYKLLYNE